MAAALQTNISLEELYIRSSCLVTLPILVVTVCIIITVSYHTLSGSTISEQLHISNITLQIQMCLEWQVSLIVHIVKVLDAVMYKCRHVQQRKDCMLKEL